MRQKQKLIILGTHSYAELVADIVSECNEFELVGFVENQDRERCRQPLLGLPVIWVDDVGTLAATHQAVCAIGTTHRSSFIKQVEAMGVQFATVRHPTAYVSRTTKLGAGTSLNVGANIGPFTTLGRHVIVNRAVLIGHHTTIGDYVTLSAGAKVAGRVSIGDGTYIGMAAVILDYLKIGSGSVVAAGSVVTKDVPDRVQVMGVPARITKDNIQAR